MRNPYIKEKKDTDSRSVQFFLKHIDNVLETNPDSAEFYYNGNTFVYLPSQQLFIRKVSFLRKELICITQWLPSHVVDNDEWLDPELRRVFNVMNNLKIIGYDSSLYDFAQAYKNNTVMTNEDFLKQFTYKYGIDKSDFIQVLNKDSKFRSDKVEFKSGLVDNEYLLDIAKFWNEHKLDMKFIGQAIELSTPYIMR